MPKYYEEKDLIKDLTLRTKKSSHRDVGLSLGIGRSTITDILAGRRGITKFVAEHMGFEQVTLYQKRKGKE